MCTPDLVFQRFLMDESKLAEYEEKWLERVDKFYRQMQPKK